VIRPPALARLAVAARFSLMSEREYFEVWERHREASEHRINRQTERELLRKYGLTWQDIDDKS
jgi:hypothetical protein